MADTDISSVARACSNCARAKSKCDWTTGARCHRCSRLDKKDCAIQQSIRKRKNPKVRRAIQIAQLEEKVNDLLSIVGHGQEKNPNHSRSGLIPLTPPSVSASTPSGDEQSSLPILLPSQPEGIPPLLTCSSMCSSIIKPHSSHVINPWKDPDAILQTFHERLAAQVPFVVVSRTITAEQLQRERPFLYLAIITAGSYEDQASQLALGNECMRYLADHLIVRGERDMDLLQGLLMCITWHHYFCHVNRQMNNLLGFMNALLINLGLKATSAENDVHECFISISRKIMGMEPLVDKILTQDEKRAVLGCYYLSSTLTATFSRLDSLRFTDHVKYCYEQVFNDAEFPTDVTLGYLTKLQSIVEKHRVNGLWDFYNAKQPDTSRAPIGLLVRSYRTELQDFHNSLPLQFLHTPALAMQYYSAEIHLYEICFKMSSSDRTEYILESLRFIDLIYAYFLSTRSFFESLFSVSALDYCTLSAVNVGQMFHAIGALYKLSIFDVPEWDVKQVRKELDLSVVLDHIANKMEQAGNQYRLTEEEGPWQLCTRKMKLMIVWWEGVLAQEGASAPVPAMPQVDPMSDFDFLNDNYWR